MLVGVIVTGSDSWFPPRESRNPATAAAAIAAAATAIAISRFCRGRLGATTFPRSAARAAAASSPHDD